MMKNTKRLYETLFIQAADAIVVIDAETGEMVRFNERAYRQLGYSAGAFKNLNIWDIDANEDRVTVLAHLADIVEGGHKVEFYAKHKARDGMVLDVHVTSAPLQLDNGRWYCQSVWHDATTELQVQEQLRHEKEVIEEFAMALGHDLRAPLRSIAHHMTNSNCNVRAQGDCLSKRPVLAAVEQMTALVIDLETFARTGKNGELGIVSLQQVVHQAIATLEPGSFRVEYPTGNLPDVLGSSAQLVRLFQNLFDNAVKYATPCLPPVIQVSAIEQGRMVLVKVADNGIGIDPQFHEVVWEPFRRLHTWAEVHGTGLGLTTCRRVVEEHGGRIWLSSVPGVGTTFKFTLQGVSHADRC